MRELDYEYLSDLKPVFIRLIERNRDVDVPRFFGRTRLPKKNRHLGQRQRKVFAFLYGHRIDAALGKFRYADISRRCCINHDSQTRDVLYELEYKGYLKNTINELYPSHRIIIILSTIHGMSLDNKTIGR